MSAGRSTSFSGPRYEVPEERQAAVAGLRKRLERREIRFLPVKRVRWAEDKLKAGATDA